MHGRWDEETRRFHARPEFERNAEAAAHYYGAGAPAPEDVRNGLGRLAAPVMIVAGEYDVGLPPRCASLYAGIFPRAEVMVIPRAGHFRWRDDSAAFVSAVTRFLASVSAR